MDVFKCWIIIEWWPLSIRLCAFQKWLRLKLLQTLTAINLMKWWFVGQKKKYRPKSKCEKRKTQNSYSPQASKDSTKLLKKRDKSWLYWAKLSQCIIIIIFRKIWFVFSALNFNIEHRTILEWQKKKLQTYRQNPICCNWRQKLNFKLFQMEKNFIRQYNLIITPTSNEAALHSTEKLEINQSTKCFQFRKNLKLNEN